jgi:hypothetical protein
VYNFPLLILGLRPVVTSCNELMLFTLSRFGGKEGVTKRSCT